MTAKSKNSDYVIHPIVGNFDSEKAIGLLGKLESQLHDSKVAGAVLDFSKATHITSGGILGLKQLGEQLGGNGKTLVVREMRSEMYKALKVAGISGALAFSHRSVSPPV